MAIQLFLKHLFTSIRRRPAQPFLLVLVLSLAVLAGITTLNIGDFIEINQEEEIKASFGNADYSIAVNSLSEIRFLSVDDVYAAVSEDIDACGAYALPMITDVKRDFVYGVATDFEQANKIFNFKFSSAKNLPVNYVVDAIYVTEEFAATYRLKVGDKVRMGFLGFEKNYFIYGVSANPFMGKYDVMVDISSMVKMMASESLYLALIQHDYMPASTVYVNTKGHADTVVNQLKEAFPDATFSAAAVSQGNGIHVMDEIMVMMMLISIFFVIFVIYCCFHIISLQRQEENALFYAVGGKSYMLNMLAMFEVAFYWFIGSIFAVLLSYPMAEFVLQVSDLYYCTAFWNAKAILISIACMLLAAEGSMLLFIATESSKKRKIRAKKMVVQKNYSILIGVGFLVLFGAMEAVSYLLPLTSRVVPTLIAFFSVPTSAFFLGREIYKGIAKSLSRRKKISVPTRYALKNTNKVGTLANSTGLFGILLIMLFSIGYMIFASYDTIDKCSNFLNGEYLVVNAPTDAVELLEKEDNIAHAYSVYMEYTPRGNKNITVMGASDIQAFSSQNTDLTKLPKGNKAIISGTYAEELGLQKDDSFKIVIGNTTLKLVLEDTVRSNGNFVYIDNEYWNIPYTYVLVKGKEGVESRRLYQSVASSLAMESVSIREADQFQGDLVDMNNKYLICSIFIFCIVFIFAVIGLTDSLAASYRSRREEFACYKAAGMGNTDLRKMKIAEVNFSFLMGIFIFLLYFAFLCYAVYMAGKGFILNFWWALL